MISIFAVLRLDRTEIWVRAEEFSRRDPTLTLSDAIYRAAKDYEEGRIHDTPLDETILDAIINNPEGMMKRGK